MFTHYRSPGIIIKKIDRGEADQLLIVYSQEFGRLEITARGVRKTASKLRPALEFAAIAEIEFIQGKTCKTLTDALIINPLRQIRPDLKKQIAVRQIFQIFDNIVKDQQSDNGIWELVNSTLVFIDSASPNCCDAVYHYFTWHLFALSGWSPALNQDRLAPQNFSLLRFFLGSSIDRAAKMRLTAAQKQTLEIDAANYLNFVTK